MRSQSCIGSEGRPALQTAVRVAAGAALIGAVAVPLLRRRLRIPAPVTVAAVATGPAAIAVLRPRSRFRDAAIYAAQMWGFVMAHELPYDDPERLRSRVRVRYPIRIDRMLGAGVLPTTRLQRALWRPGQMTALDRALSIVHWTWFGQPHATLLWILLRDAESFPRAARQMAITYDTGCAAYAAIPTAPPWWAAEEGYTGDDEVRRIMIPVGEETFGDSWEGLRNSLDGNPWAAMPSLHFGASVMAALLLSEHSSVAGTIGWGYALTLGFALVYLGEHYVTDLIAGAALVGAVRIADPAAEPLAGSVSAALQRLERIANN